jgi:hypothetical protein
LHFDLENIEAAWATSGRVIALVSMRPALNCSVGKNKKKQLSGLDFFFFFFFDNNVTRDYIPNSKVSYSIYKIITVGLFVCDKLTQKCGTNHKPLLP